MSEYVLLGEALSHSHSPRVHEMLGGYRYELMELAPEQLEDYVRARGFRGANVTIPYKKRVLPLCSRLSPEARLLGSVNTLVVEKDGSLTGHNTDMAGFLYMVRRSGIQVRGAKAVVLGSGGAGVTALAALHRLGAREALVVSRAGPIDGAALYRDHADAEIIVNATPVGMYPGNGESPVDLARLPKVRGVLDLIYNPHRTALCLQAEALGIAWESGLSMLVAQAAAAKELFTGEPTAQEQIERIRGAVLSDTLNLVLVGMPGAGKTSVARAAARAMGREMADSDQWIERQAGMPVSEIFQRFGEAHFRDLESRVLSELGARTGLVIATGGGSVLREANVRALRQNGVVIQAARPLEQLSTGGRPLSGGIEALREMEIQRAPLYRAASRAVIQNTGTIERAARAAMEGFYEAAGD